MQAAALKDSGSYACAGSQLPADGSEGVELSGSVDVTVFGFTAELEDVAAETGGVFSLTCSAAGHMEAFIQWCVFVTGSTCYLLRRPLTYKKA